jgi:methanogenic corrinoid protein MtbC1
MNEIGLLWQTDTLTPAHEHFITYLIKQKLLIHTEKVQVLEPIKTDKIFVLYLPLNEIHELGLMYLNYEILFHGYKAIYLGESVPIESLKNLNKYFDNIVFVSYLTVQPDKEEINSYISQINNTILNKENTEMWLLGRMVAFIDPKKLTTKTKLFHSISELVAEL